VEEREHWEDLEVDGRILKWILGKQVLGAWIGLLWFGTGPVAGICERVN
jgi:hypothetical protein